MAATSPSPFSSPSVLASYLPDPLALPPSPLSPPPHTMQDGKLSNGARLTAGLGAGVSEALLIVTPFEVVKTRLQQQKGVDPSLFKYKVSGDL